MIKEIDLIYVKYDRLMYGAIYSDGEAIYTTEIKSKCFFKRLINHWIDNKRIGIKDNHWMVLINEKNKTL